MTELQLYQFIQEYEIEWRYQNNHEFNQEDVIIFMRPYLIETFCELFRRKDDNPFIFHFNGEYFAIYMADICEYYEIDMKQVFKQVN